MDDEAEQEREAMSAREFDLREALAIANSPLVDEAIRLEAKAYVDAVFNESVREMRLASLEQRLKTADLKELRAITREIHEIQRQQEPLPLGWEGIEIAS